MSLPTFPVRENVPTREEVINQIISSIAMEELGLSHIINAEGEKLQYALGTIPGVTGPTEPLTIEDLLELNSSIHRTLESTMMNQFFLKEKLINSLSASIMQGPTGPTGPQGPASIDVDVTVTPLGAGEAPTVTNIGTTNDAILHFGIPAGATGPTGPASVAEASAMQVLLGNAGGGERTVTAGGIVPFDTVVSGSGDDIVFDQGSSTFTINQPGMYLVNWWLHIAGTETAGDTTIALNVGGTTYGTATPWVEAQIVGTSLAIAGTAPATLTLSNSSAGSITLSDTSMQGQITIARLGNAV